MSFTSAQPDIGLLDRERLITVYGFRGDLEILGFNLIHWLEGSLPWDKSLADVKAVEKLKTELMNDPKKYIPKHLPNVTAELIEYSVYVASLKNNDVPDYEYCRKLFTKKLAEFKCSSPYSKLNFTIADVAEKKTKKQTPKQVKSPIKKGRRNPPASPPAPDEPKKTDARKRKLAPKTTNDDKPAEVDLPVDKKKVRRGRNKEEESEEPPNNEAVAVNGTNSEEKLWMEKKMANGKKAKAAKTKKTEKELDTAPSPSETAGSGDTHEAGTSIDAKEKRVKKAAAPVKPSWKDAPTVKASNVKIAGKYEKAGSNDKPKGKKK